jgi:uncharacterized protein (DUF58 family)
MQIKEILKQVKTLDIFTNKNISEAFAGNFKSAFKGLGMEFAELRAYQEGDDVRHIDWNATAKKGEPYIKKFHETRELTNIIAVDISPSMNMGSTDKSKKEQAIQAAAIALFSANKNSDKTACLIFADKIYKYIPPKKGKAHALRILREIIDAFDKNQHISAKSNLDIALSHLNKITKRRSIVFLLTDLTEVSQYKKELRITNKRHDLVFVSILDPIETGSLPMGVYEFFDPFTSAIETINLNRESTRKKFKDIRSNHIQSQNKLLLSCKIDRVEILTSANIYKSFYKFFKKRQLMY